MILVTSWDDGHPLDERIAEMLVRHGFTGTFYVPVRNNDNRPVLAGTALRRLAQSFEIGGHTLDHVRLTGLDLTEVNRQICSGKDGIEQQIGHSIEGFCYPYGNFSAAISNAVRQSGFQYGRTVEDLRIDCQEYPYCLPTTLQFIPHTKYSLCRNFLRYGNWARRVAVFKLALQIQNWYDRIPIIANAIAHTDSVLHLWGHSWEIEEKGLWKQLEEVLARIAMLRPQSLTVMQAFLKKSEDESL